MQRSRFRHRQASESCRASGRAAQRGGRQWDLLGSLFYTPWWYTNRDDVDMTPTHTSHAQSSKAGQRPGRTHTLAAPAGAQNAAIFGWNFLGNQGFTGTQTGSPGANDGTGALWGPAPAAAGGGQHHGRTHRWTTTQAPGAAAPLHFSSRQGVMWDLQPATSSLSRGMQQRGSRGTPRLFNTAHHNSSAAAAKLNRAAPKGSKGQPQSCLVLLWESPQAAGASKAASPRRSQPAAGQHPQPAITRRTASVRQ